MQIVFTIFSAKRSTKINRSVLPTPRALFKHLCWAVGRHDMLAVSHYALDCRHMRLDLASSIYVEQFVYAECFKSWSKAKAVCVCRGLGSVELAAVSVQFSGCWFEVLWGAEKDTKDDAT